MEDQNAVPAGTSEPVGVPAGKPPEEALDQITEAMDALAGESQAQPSQPAQQEDDDPEVNLRDNTKVKLSELKRGYRPNWEKEAQAYAQRARAFAQQTQGFNQQQQATAQLLQRAVDFVATRMPAAPDPKLIESDPFEYQRQRAHYDVEQGKLQQLAATRDAHMQQAAQRQRQHFAQNLLQEKQRLHGIMPTLKDPVSATKFYQETKDYLASKRFNQKEIAGIYDHRIIDVLQDALEGRRLKGELEKAKAKLKAAKEEKPPVQEPRRRRSTAEVRNESLKDNLARLRKSGSVKDAESVLSQFD